MIFRVRFDYKNAKKRFCTRKPTFKIESKILK